jgi:hypothetical protein
MIALALNGIHEIETKYPASKMIIDEAFKAYSEMRDEEE